MKLPKTKQYCVTVNSFGKREYFYYAISPTHAKHCHYAANPHDMFVDNILDISEHPPHPSFQFTERQETALCDKDATTSPNPISPQQVTPITGEKI